MRKRETQVFGAMERVPRNGWQWMGARDGDEDEAHHIATHRVETTRRCDDGLRFWKELKKACLYVLFAAASSSRAAHIFAIDMRYLLLLSSVSRADRPRSAFRRRQRLSRVSFLKALSRDLTARRSKQPAVS